MKATSQHHNLILLIDQTQTMQPHKHQFTKHFNDFLLVQQYVSENKKHIKSYNDLDITVYTYDNSLKLQKPRSGITQLNNFEECDFSPAYAVPLYQALEQLLDHEKAECTENTTVVIISEAIGLLSENVDSHLTANLSKRISQMKSDFNWKFIHAVNTSEAKNYVIHSHYKFDETYSSSKWETLWFTIGDKVLYQRMKGRKRANSNRKRANSGRKQSSSGKSSSRKNSEKQCSDIETNSLNSEKSYSEPSLPTEGACVEDKYKIPRNKSLVEVSKTKPIACKNKRGQSLSFSCDEGIVGSA
jgi:hypothetical protein